MWWHLNIGNHAGRTHTCSRALCTVPGMRFAWSPARHYQVLPTWCWCWCTVLYQTAVNVDIYRELLTTAGFEETWVRQVPAELSYPSRQGKEWLALWKRK
jgi:hypothetical protein